jgi:hypothetical protein
MKKTLIYLLLLVVVAAATWFLVFRKDGGNTMQAGETNFRVKDTADVGKVFLADMAGNQVLLERKDDHWTVNGKYIARKDAVETLLAGINGQEAQYVVPTVSRDLILKQLSVSGVKTEVYNRNNKKLASFYVGNSTQDYMGTYMLADGYKIPYVVQIMGFRGYLTPRYFTSETEWRSRVLFTYKPEDIKKVEITYPEVIDNSFVLDNSERPTVTGSVQMSIPVNEARVKSYLTLFGQGAAEGYENDFLYKDSILLKGVKYCTLTIEGKNDPKPFVMDIYHRPVDKRSKNTGDGINSPWDGDRYFGLVRNTGDFVSIQKMTFSRILRSFGEFYVTDAPTADTTASKKAMMHEGK